MANILQHQEPTRANGYPYGRLESVEATELDRVIEMVIESLPMELRLYPDVYSWRISAAVKEYLADSLTESLPAIVSRI